MRKTIQLWEEDLAWFAEALLMILERLAYGEMPGSDEGSVLRLVNPDSGMRALPEAERPRERLLTLGAGSLNDVELLAILLGTGSHELSVLDLCSRLLSHAENDLKELSGLSVDELCRFRGIGPAKAATLLAAFELGKRAL